MQVLFVTSHEGTTPARPTVTLEMTVADNGDIFEIDFEKVCAALAKCVPFERRFGSHVLPGLPPADLPPMLLAGASIGVNAVEVGRKEPLRYFIGVQGIADAWDVIGHEERRHLWKASGSKLGGPVPRDAAGRPHPVIMTVSIESLNVHQNGAAIRRLALKAGSRVTLALKKHL